MTLTDISDAATESLNEIYATYHDDEVDACRDPFDILAALEEQFGCPLYFS